MLYSLAAATFHHCGSRDTKTKKTSQDFAQLLRLTFPFYSDLLELQVIMNRETDIGKSTYHTYPFTSIC